MPPRKLHAEKLLNKLDDQVYITINIYVIFDHLQIIVEPYYSFLYLGIGCHDDFQSTH